MSSVDGNYLKMQGEALARLQVAYQAETQAQQARAQFAAEKAVQRLREEVGATSSSEGQDRGMPSVGEQGEGTSPRDRGLSKRERRESGGDGVPLPLQAEGMGLRLDVRA